MSLSWSQRKTRLASLLKSRGDEDAEGLALDRILHGQSVIGKTSKTTEIDAIRFQDRDLSVVGTLEYGQFGVIYVVTCRLNGRVYVRKSIDKRFALRTRDQCSPQFERDILLQATKTDSEWAPHLLCAFQTPTHLNLVMDYAEGGNLWDVLESSPHDGKVPESDLVWWAPQLVSAIHWCHSQGFVHRDIKPHNFVLTPEAHVLLIDFGTAAPLLPPNADGVQYLPKRYCLIPCGTCDYISPEILKAHEEALVALEMEGDDELLPPPVDHNAHGYGRETDWWGLGAMLYEMAYGVAPFFAKDIRQTYLRIMDHEKSLHFDRATLVSQLFQDLLRRLLTYPEQRLGRKHIQEITNHPIFHDVEWDTLPTKSAPPNLHLPQFTYTEPASLTPAPEEPQSCSNDSHSQGFAFSAFFQSSQASSSSPGLSILRSRSSPYPARPPDEDTTASFIGFSWGPTLDAFPATQGPRHDNPPTTATPSPATLYPNTPRPIRLPSSYLTPNPGFITPRWSASTPMPDRFTTPIRPSTFVPHQTQTLQRTSTVRRTSGHRSVSDREAMKQLVDCIGMSARKKVLESGRKPRILTSFSSRSGTLRKELRFLPSPLPSLVDSGGVDGGDGNCSGSGNVRPTSSLQTRAKPPKPILINPTTNYAASSTSEDTDSDAPPSPSPTPRPGSAMSIMSRRSGTPTISSLRGGMASGGSTMLLGIPRSASGRSLSSSLSFSRSSMELSSSSLIESEKPTLEEMEDKLVALFGDIRSMEQRLAHVAKLIR
ncbi:Serine/threonine-protein kinase MRCK gamma [Hypsizygus marmoreus]|uniref:non-specific serine/threonine protein kinase n=1 Tax=Hypsizygus marmoreus TaxID=39966 RepID=A0A369J7U6_HYPMA|nr:Serine/threonine-protein kinase MRCK gamma [Hypsizygus marmoreus]